MKREFIKDMHTVHSFRVDISRHIFVAFQLAVVFRAFLGGFFFFNNAQ